MKVKKETGLSHIDQIGLVVKDINKAIQHFESLGIGPFKAIWDDIEIEERNVHGKPANDVKNIAMVTQLGPLEIELVQTVAGDSIQKEFLEKHGEGVNHVGVFVERKDYDKEVDKLLKKGYKIVANVKTRQGARTCAYFSTDKIGGLQIELISK
jgi:methylmalonyl-CoA/ethylmalonyl-CoA epimerase